MSRLEELIAELCPDGVEYKKLGSFATVTRGGNFQKKEFTENGVPCVHYGQIYTRYGLFADTTFTFISEETARKQKFAQRNDIIMAVTSENIEDVCKCIGWLGESEVAVSGHAAIIHHNQDPKYLTYWFHTEMFFAQKRKIAHGTKVIEVTPDKLLDVVIPVPPLPIQREIVRILDSFTELTAELTAELIARQKQYNHYASLLLSGAENKYPLVELGTVAKFIYGYTDKAQDAGDVRFIRITDILDNGTLNPIDAKYVSLSPESQKYLLKTGDIVMARTGATYGKTLYIPDDTPSVFASFLIKIQLDNSNLLNRFYWHFAQSSLYWEQAKKLVSTGGQPQFNIGAISRVKVPIPSIEDQKKIIQALDKFDAIRSSISNGLPAEIAARQKQYEYYRDKLLAFR